MDGVFAVRGASDDERMVERLPTMQIGDDLVLAALFPGLALAYGVSGFHAGALVLLVVAALWRIAIRQRPAVLGTSLCTVLCVMVVLAAFGETGVPGGILGANAVLCLVALFYVFRLYRTSRAAGAREAERDTVHG
ncbi:MAG: hypothetical protein AAFT19_11060 [Pseudomonadota bacterium]